MEPMASSVGEGGDSRKERAAVAAQACETCRTRKTRCDEGRPKCTACVRLGIECRYDEPRPTKKDKTLSHIVESLDRLELAVDRLPRRVVDSIPNRPSSAPGAAGSDARLQGPARRHTVSRRPLAWPVVQEALEDDVQDTVHDLHAFRQTGPRLVAELERSSPLSTISSLDPYPVAPRPNAPEGHSRRVVFKSVTVEMMRGLSECYFESFNTTYPVLDSQLYYANILPNIVRNGLGEADTDSIIALLVLALGRHALDGASGEPLPDVEGKPSGLRGGSGNNPPGLDFFNEARRRMGFELTFFTLEHVQIFALTALFYAQSCRHADSWRMIHYACSTCQALVACNPIDWDSSYGDRLKRLHWLCAVMQSGCLLELEFPQPSLDALQDEIPLPTFRGAEESGESRLLESEPFPYHFLAQVTLRHVVVRVYANLYDLSSASPSVEGSYYEPSRALVLELSRQLDEWRALLPEPLQWSDDNTEEQPNASGERSMAEPLFVADTPPSVFPRPIRNADILIAALRSRFCYVRFMIYLPYVYKVLSAPQAVKDEDVEYCIICLRSCLNWPVVMSPPKDTKRLLPHLFGWTYSLLNVLIVLYMSTKSPILRYAREKSFPPGLVESSAALMLDWIRDMAKIDSVARQAWQLLKQLYPV